MDRGVRSARLALVDGGGGLEGHETPIPHRGPYVGAFWSHVYGGGGSFDVSGVPGELHAPAADEIVSPAVRSLLPSAGRIDRRICAAQSHLALARTICAAGYRHGSDAGR